MAEGRSANATRPSERVDDKGKRDRKLRADVFEMPANAGKAQALLDLGRSGDGAFSPS